MEKSAEVIEELRLVSQKVSISGDLSKKNESTLQKLIRIQRMVVKEMVKGLGDF